MTSQHSSASLPSFPFQCKWGFCTERFGDYPSFHQHVRLHASSAKPIPKADLDLEIKNGQLYARDKESQGFGTFLETLQQPVASTSHSQPSTTSSSSSAPSSHPTTQTQPYIEPSQNNACYPLPQSFGPPPIQPQAAATAPAVLPSPTFSSLSSTSDLIPNSPGASSSSFSPSAARPPAAGTPSPRRRTSGGFPSFALGKKKVFGGDALRFGFGGGEASTSTTTSGVIGSIVTPPHPSALDDAISAPVPAAMSSSQDSGPSSLGAQTQLEIQAALAAHHHQRQSHSSPDSSRSHSSQLGHQRSSPSQAPSSSPSSLLGRQTQREYHARDTPFPSSPPTGAGNDEDVVMSPSPTSHLRDLPPVEGDDAMMSEYLVEYEEVSGTKEDAERREEEKVVEDELETRARM